MTISDAWNYLNSLGIYTKEEFKKAEIKNKLEIGFFVSPVK